ncbi:hypothetical protein [Singulisphaera acidiphila]|uniref:hypothetical protein n=1 Tax=Singulisphaera acidiphila TaxID=466153 RepID=UPI001ED8DA7E|nr:hypothetical protein [Singulisphaera acidiphila]
MHPIGRDEDEYRNNALIPESKPEFGDIAGIDRFDTPKIDDRQPVLAKNAIDTELLERPA